MDTYFLLSILREKITNHLNQRQPLGYGLLNGAMGEVIALYAVDKQLENSLTKANEYLDGIINNIPYQPRQSTYCNGLTGVGIGLMLLNDFGFIDLDPQALDTYDRYLSQAMNEFIFDENYDLLHGATGVALYFAKRGSANSETAVNVIRNYVLSLTKILITERNTRGQLITWCKMPSMFTNEWRNISMAHGLAGIVNVLAQIYRSKIMTDDENEKIKGLIITLSSTIIAQRLDIKKYRSAYPSYYKNTSDTNTISRLAWCYGDLGIMASLAIAAQVLHDGQLHNAVQEIIPLETSRRIYADTYVNDACICHGASGIYTFFKHIASSCYTSEAVSNTEQFWRDFILNTPFDRLCYDPINRKYTPQFNILNGYAGIALALVDDKSLIDRILLYEPL